MTIAGGSLLLFCGLCILAAGAIAKEKRWYETGAILFLGLASLALGATVLI